MSDRSTAPGLVEWFRRPDRQDTVTDVVASRSPIRTSSRALASALGRISGPGTTRTPGCRRPRSPVGAGCRRAGPGPGGSACCVDTTPPGPCRGDRRRRCARPSLAVRAPSRGMPREERLPVVGTNISTFPVLEVTIAGGRVSDTSCSSRYSSSISTSGGRTANMAYRELAVPVTAEARSRARRSRIASPRASRRPGHPTGEPLDLFVRRTARDKAAVGVNGPR